MVKRKEINNQELLKLVRSGVEQSEIMEKYDFKTSTQLKLAYANALIETGEAPEIQGTRKHRKKKTVNAKIAVNTRGSLIIPKKLIKHMGLEIGTRFEAKKTPSGIQLKQITSES